MSTPLGLQIKDVLFEFCDVPSVVGYELPFTKYLQERFNELGYTTQLINNSLYIAGEKPKSCILSAHIDRHGLIKTGPNRIEYAGFVVEKDWFHVDYFKQPNFLQSIIDEYLHQPVYAYDYHTGAILGEGVIVDIFVENTGNNALLFTVDGVEHIPIGTPFSYSVKHSYDDEYIYAQTDNALSVAMIYQLCVEGYQGSVILNPEEEIGQSRSYLQYHIEKHGLHQTPMLVLDTCPFENDAFMDSGSVVLRNKDALGQFWTGINKTVFDAVQACDIPFVYVDRHIERINQIREQQHMPLMGLGITELGQLINHTKGRLGGTSIQFPTTHYHSNHEKTTFTSVEHVYKLLDYLITYYSDV